MSSGIRIYWKWHHWVLFVTYGKFSSGDPDTSKTAASWFFACIFLIVAATILRSFFL